ncbi:MAG: hypothetical protein IKK55_00580 [Clostridia bacterium]|nr:hypothetical protein [Clostridia bacterium]
MKKVNTIKFSLLLTDIFLILLVALAFFLPFLVTWYVELTGRLESLATTIMVTCYPCAPFTGLTLFYLRKVLKNIEKGDCNSPDNIKYLMYMGICCIIIAFITLIAGKFYLPFFIVAATFLFISLLVFVFRNIFINIFNCK